MKDNNLLIIILAFVFGYCLQGMMKNMCGGRLLEGAEKIPATCGNFTKDDYNTCEKKNWKLTHLLPGAETCDTLKTALGKTGYTCREYMCGSESRLDLSNCGPYKTGSYVSAAYGDVESCSKPPNPAGISGRFWSSWLNNCVATSGEAYAQVCPNAAPESYWGKICPSADPALGGAKAGSNTGNINKYINKGT